jgi:hypothetical protein
MPTLPSHAPLRVPDCNAVARHIYELTFAGLGSATFPAAKIAELKDAIVGKVAKACTDERWSENVRLCVVDADDFERARTDCTDEPAATADEVAALPPELGCTALAHHVDPLLKSQFDPYKQKVAADPERVALVERLVVAKRQHMIADCDQRPWAIEYRRCIAAATAYADIAACGRQVVRLD